MVGAEAGVTATTMGTTTDFGMGFILVVDLTMVDVQDTNMVLEQV
jgi:hypothetical protein